MAADKSQLKSEKTADSDETRSTASIIREIVFYIVFAVLFVTLVPKYIMNRVSVDGSSMNPTLYDRDQLIGEKITTRHGRLKRYDIIYFHPAGNYDVEPYIKRIIGLPGETVQIIDSVIYVDDIPLSESFCSDIRFDGERASEPIRLGGDEYFVMGDNRNHSTDSRSEYVGSVTTKDIEGRAIFRIWPLKRFGIID